MNVSILDYFCTMEDKRVISRVDHPLRNIILIAISAVISGAECWNEIEEFGNEKKEWFAKHLDLSNGIPSHDTFNRFFATLDPAKFEECFTKWASSLMQNLDREYINIDGKTIRTASKMSDSQRIIHLVSAWANKNGIVLGHKKTDEKSNEITIIPELLDSISVEKTIITIDAMGCQKAIAEKIIDKKADYILHVKTNHPKLEDDIRSSFSLQKPVETLVTTDDNHGRVETRKYSIINNLKYILQKDEWKNLTTIVQVERERVSKKTGEIKQETQFYISSTNSINEIAEGIRSHWGIENSLHWILDVQFREDQSTIRDKYAAQNFSLLNKIGLNLLKKHPSKRSIKCKRKCCGWSDSFMEEVLNLL